MSGDSERPQRGRTRWFATAALALVAVVYAANLPFYAGASFEGWSWRMEHGRVTIERNPYLRPKPFWMDVNVEGCDGPRSGVPGPTAGPWRSRLGSRSASAPPGAR